MPTTNTNLQAALALAEKGWPVFPCHESGGSDWIKRPYTAHGWKDAIADALTIVGWWEQWPAALPAIACGAAGLLVIDCDNVYGDKDGPSGLSYLAEFCQLHGGLPETMQVNTPHGLHLYFTVTADQLKALPGLGTGWSFEAHKGTEGTHLDFRAAGGYVIAPGAVMPDGTEYKLANDLPPIPLPSWLEAGLTKAKPAAMPDQPPSAAPAPVQTQAATAATQTARRRERKDTLVMRDGLLRRLELAAEGHRNDEASKVSRALAGLVGAGRLPESGTWDLLLAAAERNGIMQEEPTKTLHSLQTAWAKGLGEPIPWHDVRDDFQPLDPEQAAKPVPPFVSVRQGWRATTDRIQRRPLPLATGLDAVDRVLDGGIRPGLTVLGGTPGSGKSTLALQIADHIAAAGTPVLYYALEMTEPELRIRSVMRYTAENLTADLSGDWADNWQSEGINPNGIRAVGKATRLLCRGDYEGAEQACFVYPVARHFESASNAYYEGAASRLFIRDGLPGHDTAWVTAEGIAEDVQAFREAFADQPAPLVVVDYLQLLHVRDRAADRTEYDRMNSAALTLKKLAGEGLSVFVISSFSRASYYTRPSLEGFKASGGIEYTASAALCLGFREFVDPDSFKGGSGMAIASNRAVRQKYQGKEGNIPARLEIACVKARDFEPASPSELEFYGPVFKFGDVRFDRRISQNEIYKRLQTFVDQHTPAKIREADRLMEKIRAEKARETGKEE